MKPEIVRISSIEVIKDDWSVVTVYYNQTNTVIFKNRLYWLAKVDGQDLLIPMFIDDQEISEYEENHNG